MARAALVGLVVFASLTVGGIWYGPSPITGDETEYYAMTCAWAQNGSPTLTPGVVSDIRAAFPGRTEAEPVAARAVDGSYNAIHFWFLSLLATPFFWLCHLLGLNWRHCFTILNALLFAGAAAFAYRRLRWVGAVVLVVGLLDSPLLPYLNKAHAETYAVSLTAVAAVSIVSAEWLAAALALSLVAVQISAFSPLAVIALGVWGVRCWQRASRREWAAVMASLLLLGLQPLWTLWRYHTWNVIITEGYVFPEMATARRIVSILVDPDVGLLFLWPLAVALFAGIAVGIVRQRALWRDYRGYWLFAAAMIAEVAYVGAQQMNYTTSGPRYSLWYLPLLLVGFIIVIRERARVGAACFILAAALNGWYLFGVAGAAPNLQRKPLAEWWYRHLPSVWNPDEQVFTDFSLYQQIAGGRELFFTRRFPAYALLDTRAWAISNQGCTKVLVFGYAFTSSNVTAMRPLGCEAPVDAGELLQYVRQTGVAGIEDRYVSWRSQTGGEAALEPPGPDRGPPRVVRTDGRTFEFADPDGWQDLDVLTMSTQSCTVIYDQPRHELSILRENGTLSLPAIPGRRGELKSRGCKIDPREVSIVARGESLTVRFPSPLDAVAYAVDFARPATDVTYNSNPRDINVLRIDHSPDVARIWLLVNDRRSEEHACYLAYETANHLVRLMPDNGDGVSVPAAAIGDGQRLENGRCILDAGRSTVASLGDKVALQLSVTRTGLFDRAKRVWERHQMQDGAVTDWEEIGMWPGSDAGQFPMVTVRHQEGLHVELQYTSPKLPQLSRIWVLINNRLDAEGACYITYDPVARALYLNAAGDGGGPGSMLLSDERVLGNSHCELDGRGSTVKESVAGISLDLRVSRKGRFRNPQRIWVADQTGEGRVSPWVEAGIWR